MKHKAYRFLGLALVLALLGIASAQNSPLNPAAAQSIQRGQQAVAQAQATGQPAYPDQPIWHQAIQDGLQAVRQAPGRPEPLYFLANVYSMTRWYAPAWQTWMEYLQAGGALDQTAKDALVQVGTQLGFINYQRKDYDAALSYYHKLTELVPNDSQAYTWMGRILMETNRPAQAIPYWQKVTQLKPGDKSASYFLQLAQDQAKWGTQAVNAFYQGVDAYDKGNLQAAQQDFARATTLSADYPDAWAWLGRVAFEQGDYQNAAIFYGKAVALDPANNTYGYFYKESQRRQGGAVSGGGSGGQ
jgi:tetratricopeptide (TPR) repeat protein